jgi:hypothetical protein
MSTSAKRDLLRDKRDLLEKFIGMNENACSDHRPVSV